MSELSHKHVPPGTLRAYREGRTGAAETLAVSDALAECAGCRAVLAGMASTPVYTEIAEAADRGGEGAFADDPAARAELDDLLAFRREVAERGGEVFNPDPGTDLDTGRSDVSRKVVLMPRALWTREPFMMIAAAAATVALLAGGWWMFAPMGTGGARQLLTDGQGHRFGLSALPAELREAVRGSLREERLPVNPAVVGLRPAAGRLAGTADAAEFRAVGPLGVVTRELQPTLRWTARTGVERYRVVMVDAESAKETVEDLPAEATRWTVPELVAGRTYEWQVEAVAGGETIDRAPKPPAPEARFRTLGETERKEIAQVEASYGQYPLVMAVAYARAGLVEEEAVALEQLAREHPQSALARRLRDGGRYGTGLR